MFDEPSFQFANTDTKIFQTDILTVRTDVAIVRTDAKFFAQIGKPFKWILFFSNG